mgnify:CR=1 FL=1
MDGHTDIQSLMHEIGRRAKDAATELSVVSSASKNTALKEMAASLRRRSNEILSDPDQAMVAWESQGRTGALLGSSKST